VRRPWEGKRCTKRWYTAETDTQIIKKRKRRETRWPHIENGNEEPVEKCDGDANISRSPPRDGKRGAVVRNLTPVESENTHGKTMGNPEELVDLGIVWDNPANPRKARESTEEISRQEV
jgi:hypothetical protein